MALTQQSGFGFPMIQQGSQGHVVYLTQDTVGLINASILQILLTMPGERWWNPSFGCLLRKMQFENLTQTSQNTIKSIVLQALATYETRITVTAADIVITVSTASDNSTPVSIQISYTVNNPDFTTSRQPTVVVLNF